jgi:signal transduction histidine kinase
MLIQDDGKGFDVCGVTNEIACARKYWGGNGIKNMKARAGDMNADLCFKSEINEGTTVQLTVHL